MSDSQTTLNEEIDEDRRDFIHIATGATAAAGLGLVGYIFVDQMNAASDTMAASSLDIDTAAIPVGGEIRVLIGGKPFFLRRLTPEELAAATDTPLDRLPDPESHMDRVRPLPNGEFDPAMIITSGACTHLGCVPVGPGGGNLGDFGGWFCPCHASHYDTSGRVRRGPAPKNLPVPDYEYVTDSVVKISL